MNRIIYPNEGGVAVLIPSGTLAIEEVARKDVPAGVPFRIVGQEDIPIDRSERDRWEADFSNPDGHGIGADAWFAEYAAAVAASEGETDGEPDPQAGGTQ
ncbi:hypothetical protein JF546_09865 [Nitratireductor aquimarinus]|uniref:hypothetical protein n=1 Tax=Nitratireductor aquimarinus TaxID=889300 RepID=UPI001A8C9A67|nr:hypothetical protein [Nitratireductor aquimarinus]MBN8243316.1 hypothetical protein [Nitratireductor aquimarinus]MBY6131217.1 hypothetical protein [Nitratireductor aquimarinus]MCA1302027.1 hypothetical protein [Nitratireductor aquimarinus]